MKEARSFAADMWHAQNQYDKPERMDIYDAAANLSEYIADGIPVPEKLTPALYALLWNRLCRTGGRFC